jgi:RNA polymerase sigma-70 factor (ECF subfamily)
LNVAEQAAETTQDDGRHRDLQLAAQAQAGSEDAWDAILNEHYLPTWKLSFGLTRDEQLAEDLLQATFLKVKENLGQFQGQCGIGGWIHTICRNRFRDDLKYQRRRSGNVSMDAMEESDRFWQDVAGRQGREDPAEAWITRMDLERALALLGEEEREAYVLMKVLGYTSEEAGKLVGVPATTMRSRLARAREHLSDLLPAYGEEDS